MYIDTEVLNVTIYSGSSWVVVVDHENKGLKFNCKWWSLPHLFFK